MRSILAITVAAAFGLMASNAYALQKGQGHGPKVKTTTSAPKAHTPQGGPKATAAGPKTTGAPKVHAQGPKAKTTKTKTAMGGPKKTTTTSTGTVATTGTKKSATATTSTTSTGDTPTLTAVQLKLQRNTNLASKLEGRLPAGTDLMTAAEGFRNLGQFVAAVNVSNNLGIPFVDLKTRMVDDGMSLGQAIKAERPNVDSTTELRRAETEATRVIESTETTTTTSKKKTKGRG